MHRTRVNHRLSRFHGPNRSGWRRLVGVALVALIGLLPASAPAVENTTALSAALDSITADELQAHVDYLAGDDLQGRLPGTDGSRRAGDYLRDRLKELDLEPAGPDGSFFQPFEPNYRNVLAKLPGRDPELRDQVILVGAHYDHVGLGSPGTSRDGVGQVHNGADDNASGTSGILELAEAFALLPQPPRRTIVFALWDAEELGFDGSRHFVAYPPVPLENIALMVNLDMIGRVRDDTLHVFGTRSSHGLRRLVSRHNTTTALKIDFSWDLRGNSDHWTFFEQDVPVLMFHTGIHDDYHTPRDDAELLNKTGMRRVTRLLFGTVYELAERDQRPAFRAAARDESQWHRNLRFNRPPALPNRLGARWARHADDKPGVMLTRVDHDGPAHRAGLKPADRVVKVGHHPIHEPGDLEGAAITAPSPVTVTVQRRGHDEPIAVDVTPDGNPWRLGFSWAVDEAEPGAAVIVYVVPATPAARAGLKPGDIVYRFGGKTFADSDALIELAREAGDPVELTIERDGRRHREVIHTRDLPPSPGA